MRGAREAWGAQDVALALRTQILSRSTRPHNTAILLGVARVVGRPYLVLLGRVCRGRSEELVGGALLRPAQKTASPENVSLIFHEHVLRLWPHLGRTRLQLGRFRPNLARFRQKLCDFGRSWLDFVVSLELGRMWANST